MTDGDGYGAAVRGGLAGAGGWVLRTVAGLAAVAVMAGGLLVVVEVAVGPGEAGRVAGGVVDGLQGGWRYAVEQVWPAVVKAAEGER